MSINEMDAVLKHMRIEERVLLYCARLSLNASDEIHLDECLRQSIDWDYLIEAAHNHAIVPLVFSCLERNFPESVPPQTLDTLRLRFLSNASRNHFFTQELLKILHVFETHGLGAVPFKGPVLAWSIFAQPSLRQYGDLDILIHGRDLKRAKEVLASIGYQAEFQFPNRFDEALVRNQQNLVFFSPDCGVLLDLHWRLEPGKLWSTYSDRDLWERLESVAIDGQEIPCLSVEDQILYACVHGCNHSWQRLAWICDISGLLEHFPGVRWEMVLEQAARLKRKRMLFLGLCLANELLKASVPAEIDKEMRNCPLVEKLTRQVAGKMFGEHPVRHRVLSSFSFRLSTRESIRDKWFFCLGRFVIPDPLDLGFLRLPKSLFFCYFLLRPVRLVIRYAPKAIKKLVLVERA